MQARVPGASGDEPVLAGPVSSIRWEMLRDGIEDYEYMVILRKLLKTKEEKLTARQLQKYNALLEVPESITKDMTHFTKDPAPIEAYRDRIAQVIARLNRL